MKKFLLTAGVLSLMMASCSHESLVPGTTPQGGGDSPAVVPTKAMTRLSFDVSLPAGDPITYAEIQTPQEKVIERIDVYQFGDGADAPLEAVYNDVSKTASGTGYKLNLLVSGTGMKQFVFVANNLATNQSFVPGIENLTAGAVTYADFLKKTTQAIRNTPLNGAPLLMTGKTVAIDVNANTPNQRVEMLRVMSRVDIRNYEPKLSLTRAYLTRSANMTTLDGLPPSTGLQFVDLPEATLPTTATSGAAIDYELVAATNTEGQYDFYKHVFYPYPSADVTQEAQAPVIVVEGILFKGDAERETKVVYRKPFKIKDQQNFLGFKRNTRYTLVIKRAIPGEVDAEFIVDKWNEDEIDAPLVGVQTPRISGVYLPGWITPSRQKWANDALTLSKHSISTQLKVSSNSEWEILIEGAQAVAQDKSLGEWARYEEYTNAHYHRPEDKLYANVSIIVNENTTNQERSIRCILRSKADKNKRYAFTITQKASESI